ncbi:MAG: hypothetical protein MUO84_00320, partial [Thermoplasmata archaeon]|nr:hypothetical protein [Thermoplasmata archaeon]
YYHRLFKGLGLKPEDVKAVEDLQRPPVLTKELIKRNWDGMRPMNLKSIGYVDRATMTTSIDRTKAGECRFAISEIVP